MVCDDTNGNDDIDYDVKAYNYDNNKCMWQCHQEAWTAVKSHCHHDIKLLTRNLCQDLVAMAAVCIVEVA